MVVSSREERHIPELRQISEINTEDSSAREVVGCIPELTQMYKAVCAAEQTVSWREWCCAMWWASVDIGYRGVVRHVDRENVTVTRP